MFCADILHRFLANNKSALSAFPLRVALDCSFSMEIFLLRKKHGMYALRAFRSDLMRVVPFLLSVVRDILSHDDSVEVLYGIDVVAAITSARLVKDKLLVLRHYSLEPSAYLVAYLVTTCHLQLVLAASVYNSLEMLVSLILFHILQNLNGLTIGSGRKLSHQISAFSVQNFLNTFLGLANSCVISLAVEMPALAVLPDNLLVRRH